eukprot:9630106-Alexandrium_andersonii.AAC.1
MACARAPGGRRAEGWGPAAGGGLGAARNTLLGLSMEPEVPWALRRSSGEVEAFRPPCRARCSGRSATLCEWA